MIKLKEWTAIEYLSVICRLNAGGELDNRDREVLLLLIGELVNRLELNDEKL